MWLGITKILDEDKPVKEEHKKYWRIGQWFTTGFLWWTWLSHDMANIVFLPRELPVDLMVVISAVFVAGLWWMFREGGGKIQNIVLENTTLDMSEVQQLLMVSIGLFYSSSKN